MVPESQGINGIRSWATTFKSSKLTYSRRGWTKKSKRKLTKYYPWNHYLLYTCPSSSVVCLRFWYYWQLRCSGWKPWCLFFLILSCLSVHPPTYIYLTNSQNLLKSEQFWPHYKCPISASSSPIRTQCQVSLFIHSFFHVHISKPQS